MKNINQFKIEFFGTPFLEGLNVELPHRNQIHSIPARLQFNSPWRIIHNCVNCGNAVEFIENSQKPERNYKTINKINSTFRDAEYLNAVCVIFPNLELIELDGVQYVNRTDVDYQFDLQRIASVELKHHQCENCNADYLSIIRIGYPVEREKGSQEKPGGIGVVQITCLNKAHVLLEYL